MILTSFQASSVHLVGRCASITLAAGASVALIIRKRILCYPAISTAMTTSNITPTNRTALTRHIVPTQPPAHPPEQLPWLQNLNRLTDLARPLDISSRSKKQMMSLPTAMAFIPLIVHGQATRPSHRDVLIYITTPNAMSMRTFIGKLLCLIVG